MAEWCVSTLSCVTHLATENMMSNLNTKYLRHLNGTVLNKLASIKETDLYEQKFMRQNMEYVRNHPFFPEWKEWPAVVVRYHSAEITKQQMAINKAYRLYETGTFSSENEWMIDEIYFNANRIHHEFLSAGFYNKKTLSFELKTFIENLFFDARELCMRNDMCACTDFYIDDDLWQFPGQECQYAEQHIRAHIISFMWAFVFQTKPRKTLRKYYKRLERVILSLPRKYLVQVTPELIVRPELAPRGRNLLREIYARAMLDPVDVNDFVLRTEYLKHFVANEQAGTSRRCKRDVSDVHDEMIQIAKRLFRRNSPQDYFSVQEQGPFDIQHKVSWNSEDFTRLKDLLDKARDEFMAAFKTTLIGTAKMILCMFVMTTVVCLLAKIAIGASALIIYKLIHLICSLVFGVSDNAAIEQSLAENAESEEITTIPIIPRLVTKYLINPPSDLLATIWNSRQTDLIMRRIGYLGDIKVERGLERVMYWMKTVVSKTVRWFCQTYLGIDCPEELDGDNHSINKWQDDVDDLLHQYYDGTLVWSESTWSVVYNLYSRGLMFTRSPAYAKDKNDVWKVVSKLGNLLEQFKKYNRDGQSIRNPPVTIYLYGETGVGKSALTYPLAVNILKRIFAQENNTTDLKKHWKSLIYMRSAEQEYWDGYMNQLVTLFDDFNQQCDSGANPSIELFEIIRASNCFPYPLHMAAIEEKATTTFTSKIIIVSSNNKKPKTQSLNYPKALERRFDLAVEVRRKPNVKLTKDSKFDETIYEFSLYDMVSGEILERGIDFNKLTDLSVIEYFSRRSFVDSIDGFIKDLLDKNDKVVSKDEIPIKCAASGKPVEQGAEFDFAPWDTEKKEAPFNGYEPDSKPFYKRWYDFLYTWLNPSLMDELRMSVFILRRRAAERLKEFKIRQEKHKYLINLKYPLVLLTGGLAFIGLYAGIKRILKPKEKNNAMLTEKQYLETILPTPQFKYAKKLVEESYTPTQIRQAKVESFVPPSIATIESYSPVQVKVAKIESGRIEKAQRVLEEGVSDLNAAEILIKVAKHNMYKMYNSTTGKAIGHILFLRGNVGVIPRHFLNHFKAAYKQDPQSSIYFKNTLLTRSFELPTKDLIMHCKAYQSDEEEGKPCFSRDLMAVAVPTSIVHMDATKFFCKRNSLNYVQGTKVQLPVLVTNDVTKSDRAILMIRYGQGNSGIKRCDEPLTVLAPNQQISRYVRDAWEYSLDTVPSECGAPLIVRNSQITPGKICGIHIAGVEKSGLGFSTPLYYEDVIEMVNSFEDTFTVEKVFQMKMNEYPSEQSLVPDDAEFLRLGSIDVPIVQPTKSKIRPSLAYNKIREPKTRPTLLRATEIDGEKFDPRVFRIKKIGNLTVPLPEQLIDNAQRAFVDEVSEVIQKADVINENVKPVYSFEEAVRGIDGEDYINSIKRSTSAGFPFVQNKKSKFYYFGEGDQLDVDSPRAQEIKARVSEIIEKAKKNISLDHYFMDTLKDERKPKEKYYKTRLFSAGPLDYLLACKMYFNPIVNLISKSRNNNHISVGTNPYSLDWHRIRQVLKRKSNYNIAGDFEGFDASQQQRLLNAAGESLVLLSRRFCNSSEEDCRVMRVLLKSLINSLHIVQNEVYQWTHSLPSGHYLTAIINSVFVNIAFLCVWQLAFGISYMGARSFYEECGLVAYGDDHICSVPRSRLSVFNQMTLPALFSKIGLNYTMEDKDKTATEMARPIEQVSFLKRGFATDEETGFTLAPLTLETVLETPMWMKDCPDDKAQTIENIDWALKELSLHDRETWCLWSPVLQLLQQELGYYTKFCDQRETRNYVAGEVLIM